MIYVTKRDGRREPFDQDKIYQVLCWAAEGLSNVSVSQVELSAKTHIVDGVPTSEIHKAVIRAAEHLISPETPDYQYMAARLHIFNLYKEVFGNFDRIPDLKTYAYSMVKRDYYDADIVNSLTDAEWEELEALIDHSKDMNFANAGVRQLISKYLLQDRHTGEMFETPQFAFMMIAVSMFHTIENRMFWIKETYKLLSDGVISLPTPIMAGLRGKLKQFSSCVVMEVGDSLDSIGATSTAIMKYVAQRSGIGVSLSRIRAVGSKIRGSEVVHTGCTPFYKHIMTAVKSCSQGGIRGGAATASFLGWHYEFEALISLKNNRGTENTRARHMDYNILLNRTLYERLISGGNISLFSPNEVPGLYDAFFEDQEEFERLYKLYESDLSIRRNTMSADDYWALIASERSGTGRIYLQNVDHTNSHGAFNPEYAPVRQSNLCMEIALPTSPIEDVRSDDGEISLCTLAAFNLAKINRSNIWIAAQVLVRGLDLILDYQEYPVPAAKRSTMCRRPLGIGVINLAYWIAKNGYRYSDGSALQPVHDLFEMIQYHLLKASNEWAAERGACPLFHETTYAQGLLPIDTYKRDVDDLAKPEYHYDWEELRERIKEHGLRNSTLMALMPSETSSQVSNATNGIEPPRSLMTVKTNKDSVVRQLVPDIETLADAYETIWMPGVNIGKIKLAAVMQKFVDQAISLNTDYDPKQFGGSVPQAQVIQDLFMGYKYGIKTWYYHNTRDGADDKNQTKDLSRFFVEPEDDCEGGACKI